MGSLFSGPPAPPKIPAVPPAAHPAVLGSNQLALAGDTNKAAGAAAAGMGFDDTIKTSQKGLTAPATAKTTLLGG
jgi:hypothetical protein